MPKSELPPLRALQVFDTAAKCATFHQAAASLGMPVGSVSRFVKQLEDDLGCVLFYRHSRGITLTDAGATYHEEVAAALQQLVRASRQVRSPKSDPLTIWCSQAIGALWLSPMLDTLRRGTRQPKLKLTVSSQQPRLTDASPDFAFAADYKGDFARQGAAFLPCFREQLTVVCAPELAAKLRQRRLPAMLMEAPLLTCESMMPEWRAWMAAAGATPDVLEQSTVFESSLGALEAARTCSGLALAELNISKDLLGRGRLEILCPDIVISGFDVGLHWMQSDRRLLVADALMRSIKDMLHLQNTRTSSAHCDT